MAYADVSMEVDTDELARGLARSLNYDSLMTFVMELDGWVGDIDFTKSLIAELEKALEDEEV